MLTGLSPMSNETASVIHGICISADPNAGLARRECSAPQLANLATRRVVGAQARLPICPELRFWHELQCDAGADVRPRLCLPTSDSWWPASVPALSLS